jgi:TRAP-type transport system periplasmic protein
MAKSGLARWCAAIAAAAVVSGTLGATQLVEAQERRIATLAPPGSTWMQVFTREGQEIEQRTEGRVTTRYYPGGVQGDEREVVRKMRRGQLDGAALTSVGLSLIDESIRVLELPRLFESVEELDYVRSRMWPHFQKKFEEKGFILSEPGDVGHVYFYSKRPVTSMQDLTSSRVWMWTDDRLVRAMYQKLGINGVPLGVPDVLPALQTGRIDAAYGSPLSTVALQWHTQFTHSTSMAMSYAIGAGVMRKELWEQLEGRDREVIRRIERVVRPRLMRVVRNDNQRAFNAMKTSGMNVVETPSELVQQFDRAAQQVWREMVGTLYSQEELDMVLRYRQEFRSR